MITKTGLRKMLIEKRKKLSAEYRQSADYKIFQSIIDLEAYQKANTIFCFVSTEDEINTHLIIKHALSCGKIVVVPKCISKGIMHAYQIHSFEDLESGKYGILEPKQYCKLVHPEEIDVAVVPCLSCNSEGYRIGYGGGFYDRYLRKQHFFKIAICYEKLILDEIPTDSYDEKVDMIIKG